MDDLTVHQVIVDHLGGRWNCWPETGRLDFSEALAYRSATRYNVGGGRTLTVVSRYYPAYLPFVRAGVLRLPGALAPGLINNALPPPQAVVDQQLQDLTELSKECEIILWRHSYNCWPWTAQHLPRLFKFRILEFGDDCPGSSEFKTFPVVRHFDVYAHNMVTWDPATGSRVADVYRERGMTDCRFFPMGPSTDIPALHRASGFDIHAKAESIARGQIPKSLAFVGCAGTMNPARHRFSLAMNEAAVALDAEGWNVRLHGLGMRNGLLAGHTNGGPDLAALYAGSLFGYNVPISSIYNGRLSEIGRAHV